MSVIALPDPSPVIVTPAPDPHGFPVAECGGVRVRRGSTRYLTEVLGDVDALGATPEIALAELEMRLAQALSDVRALRQAVASGFRIGEHVKHVGLPTTVAWSHERCAHCDRARCDEVHMRHGAVTNPHAFVEP